MFRKSIMALAIATVATASMGVSASAGGFKIGWGGHHHNHHYKARIYIPTYSAPSCHYYKKKWKWTHKTVWKKKYVACLILKNH